MAGEIVIDLKFDADSVRRSLTGAFAGRRVVNLADDPDKQVDISAADYAVVWKPDSDLFTRAPSLKVIFSGGAGVDSILSLPGLPADIPLVRFVDRSLTDRMSEWVVLQCLTHLRQVHAYASQQKRHHWQELPQPEAADVTVGVMGLGVLGSDALRKLKIMGFQVIGWSRTAKELDGVETYAGRGELDAFLGRCDILVGLLPLTPETTGLFDHALFSKLKRKGPLGGPVFLNAGRGKSQNGEDLYRALTDGTLYAASVDVFEEEPLPANSPLWDLDNLILTPHAAAASDERALFTHVERQIRRLEAGEALQFLVARDAGY